VSNEVQLVVLGGVIAATAGILSQLIGQHFNRSNHKSELRRTKAEHLALALVDIHRATKQVLNDPTGKIDDLLIERNSVREIEVLARLYFPHVDLSAFIESSNITQSLAKEVASTGKLADDDWPRFTSAVLTFGLEADRILGLIATIVQQES
jgi:hypothetical protein